MAEVAGSIPAGSTPMAVMTLRRWIAGSLAAPCLLSSACTGSSEPAPRAAVSPAAQTSAGSGTDPVAADPVSRCPGHEAAAARGGRVGGEIAGDVDGDEAPDLVYLVRDEQAEPGCKTVLVVESAGTILAAPADEEGVDSALQAPHVNSIVQVDGEGGSEILVDLEQGASTQFLAMFTLVDEMLRRVAITGGSAYGNLFPYGGSVGHIEASNCTDEAGADVVISIATPNIRDYSIRRRLYEMIEAEMIPLKDRLQPPVARAKDVARFAEYNSSPFGDCG